MAAEWLEQWLCNLQRQQSYSAPGLNPAQDYNIKAKANNKATNPRSALERG